MRVALSVSMLLSVLAVGRAIAEPAIDEWLEIKTGSFRGESRVEVHAGTGESVEIRTAIQCSNGFAEIENPFLQADAEMHTRVIIFDEDGRYVGDVMPSGRNPELKRRCVIRSGQSVGTQIILAGGDKTVLRRMKGGEANEISALGPGKYFVQSFSTNAIFSQRVANGERRLVGRSNAILFQMPFERREIATNTAVKGVSVEFAIRSTSTAESGLLDICVSYVNRSTDTVQIFNAGLSTKVSPAPLKILVTAPDGKVFGDLLAKDVGSLKRLGSKDWMRLPPNGVFSCTRSLTSAHLTGVRLLKDEFAARHYRLQPIVLDTLISDDPFNGEGELKDPVREWKDQYRGVEIARTRPIDFVITRNVSP